MPTPHDVAPDPGMAALVERYRQRVARVAMKVVGDTDSALTRSGGELGRLAAEAERRYAGADAAVVDAGALRADVDAGPITYADVAEAFAYGHRIMRVRVSGSDLRALAASRFYSGPSTLDDDTLYDVAASEMLVPHGRPAGPEVEAISSYLRFR